jgi:8-oxo-dGTP pyrophosphatase MutT (NUDIX family)
MCSMYSDIEKPLDDSDLPDASTVILIRDGGQDSGEPFEIFLMRRHRAQEFMGDATVFPGGRLDDEDCDPILASYVRGLTPEEARLKLKEPDLSNDRALGLFLAAVRETFEEAGILLATTIGGEWINFEDDGTETRFSEYRLRLHKQELSLRELADQENIRYSLDMLTPYSHWITPRIEGKRFDTRFFLARLPDKQMPIHDSIEMTESIWLTPRDALARCDAGQILLMPPTLKTIEELSGYSSADQLFTTTATRTIYPILPQFFQTADSFGVRLPHDAEYSIGEYKQPIRMDESSRIVMIDGRWKTMRANDN